MLIWIVLLLYIFISCFEIYYQINFHRYRKPMYYENTLLSFSNNSPYTDYGYKMAPHKKIVITGLCRNAAAHIGKNLQIAIMIGSFFQEYKIVVYENDSTDNTREILDRYAQSNKNIIVIGKDIGAEPSLGRGPFHHLRFERMAYYRNQYLKYIRQHFNNYDYMMVIDWDMNGSTDIDGIMNTIGRDHESSDVEWGAIGTSGKVYIYGTLGLFLMNYDMIALRFHHVNYDKMSVLKHVIYNVFYQQFHRLFYNDLEPVESTFHGIIIYKMSCIPKDAQYTSEFGCEHISFNKQITKPIFINPYWTSYFGVQGPNWFKTLKFDLHG